MWYLLLSVPALALGMGVFSRFGKITDTDRACTDIDLRLDHQAQLVSAGAQVPASYVPEQKRVSRVAPRPALRTTELLAS